MGALVGGFVAARLGGLDALAGAALVGLAVAAAPPAQGWLGRCAALGLGLAALGAVLALAEDGLTRALDLLPAAVNGLLAWHFGATLRPGREPLIARYTRLDWGRMPAGCEGYARGLTVFWATVLGLLALAHAAVLAQAAPAAIDRGAALAANAALVTGLFLGEHVLRTLRFPHLGVASPLRTVRVMLLAAGTSGAAALASDAAAAATTTTHHAG